MNSFARIFKQHTPLIILILLNIVFFNKMLLGSEMFVTPDFGKSDILHSEYASASFFSQSLKSGQSPLWNPYLTTGFPGLGTFQPVNVLLLWLLPTAAAYNYIYLSIFLTTAIFTYLFCRQIKLTKVASLFTAIVFNFSGIMISQTPHQGILQALSFFPAQLYFAEVYIKKKKPSALIFLSAATGLSILSGFYQVVLYSLIMLCLYLLIRLTQQPINIKKKIMMSFNLLISLVIGTALAAVQIMPMLQMTNESVRSSGVNSQEISRFPYAIKHIMSFLDPYLYGDPRVGTYPVFSADWGIFWESTGYLGILPIFLAIIVVFSTLTHNNRVKVFTSLAVVSFLLMLGKNSPFFFIHTIPPFSFFRVPVRWIIFFTFFLSILAGLGFNMIEKAFSKIKQLKIYKNRIIIILLSAATINIMMFAFGYNPRANTDKWLRNPETVNFLKKDKSFYRIATYGNDLFWNSIFLRTGWKNSKDQYLPLLNSLEPNSNLIWQVHHSLSYPVLITRRDSTLRFFLQNNIKQQYSGQTKNNISGTVKINKTAKKIIDIQSVKYLITPFKIEADDIKLVHKTKTKPSYNIYRNKSALPRAYIVGKILTVNQANEFLKTIPSSDFDPSRNVILESFRGAINLDVKKSRVKVIRSQNSKIELEADLDARGILVLADSYYPGWQAEVDGVKTEIFPANINQRAIIVDKGKHKVVFYFTSEKFWQGLAVSTAALLILIISTAANIWLGRKNH